MQEIKKYWSAAEGAFCCLIDSKRTKIFKEAIFDIVRKGDVVVDAGTGTGILALFAAKAGAKRVYVLEIDSRSVSALEANFKINGFGEKIKVIKGNAIYAKLPEKVDVIICEMIATGLIEELQIPVMNNMLKYAKKNVKLLIKSFSCFVDLVYNNASFYDCQLNIFRYEYPEIRKTKSLVLSETKKYFGANFCRKNKLSKINKKISLRIKKDGMINGIRISCKTLLGNGKVFDFSSAYSFPLILPIENRKVKKNEKYEVTLAYTICSQQNDLTFSIHKQ